MKITRTAVTPSSTSSDSSDNKNTVTEKNWEANKNELSFHADLIRTVGIFLVILLHSAVEPHPIVIQPDQAEVFRWLTVTIYDTLSQPGVPLFVLVSGALLLQPSKKEPVKVFLKKRVKRIVWPLLFWNVVYFVWRYAVQNETLTATSIIEGLESGAYYHFWFMYMMFGIYLITPLLRVLIAHSDRNLIRYGLILWFVTTAVIPVIGLFYSPILSNRALLDLEWVGYFILGLYLLKLKIRPLYLYLFFGLGIIYTLISTYLIQLTLGGAESFFFADPTSANMIIITVSIFLLLRRVSATKIQNKFPRLEKLIHTIGQNTLPIYLLHIIVLETFQKGYLGIQISVNTLNPTWEIPFLAVLTLFICLGIALPLKRIPILKKLIG